MVDDFDDDFRGPIELSKVRISLWRATFRELWQQRQKLASWILIALILQTSVQFFQIKSGIYDSAPNPSHKISFGAMMLSSLLMIVVGYALTVIYFQERPIAKPQSSVGNFFYYLGCRIGAMLISALPLMIAVILIVVAFIAILPPLSGHHPDVETMLKKMGPAKLGLFGLWSIILYTAGMIGLLFLSIKYFCIGGLVVNGGDDILKTSWRMAEGRWWWLFGNFLMFMLLTSVPFWAAFFTVRKIIAGAGGGEMLASAPSASIAFLLGTAGAVMFTSAILFECVAFRTIYEEMHAADPPFSLPS